MKFVQLTVGIYASTGCDSGVEPGSTGDDDDAQTQSEASTTDSGAASNSGGSASGASDGSGTGGSTSKTDDGDMSASASAENSQDADTQSEASSDGTSTGGDESTGDDDDTLDTGSGDDLTIPEVPCGGPETVGIPGMLGIVTLNALEENSQRGFALSYPCNMNTRDRYTVLLNMHGTMPEETLRGYQHFYFPAHEFMESHNVVVITPIAAADQWRDDADQRYVLDTIAQVYRWLEGAQLEKMWLIGHSWGGYYIKTGDPGNNAGFACDPGLAEYDVQGVIALAGGPTPPSCDISHLHVTGSADPAGTPIPDLTPEASTHGCSARSRIDDIVDGSSICVVHEYPDCADGFIFGDYEREGKGHLEAIEPNVMLSILDEITEF